MKEIRQELQSIILSATEITKDYPLKSFDEWKDKLSFDGTTYRLFIHAVLAYASGFNAILNDDELEDYYLSIFSGFLSQTKCKVYSPQIALYFLHLMKSPATVFSKRQMDVHKWYSEHRDHFWSPNDILGTVSTRFRESLPDNHSISEDRVSQLIQMRHVLIRGRARDTDSYKELFENNEKQNEAVVRRPLWLQCSDPSAFIDAYSALSKSIETVTLTLDDITSPGFTKPFEGPGIVFLKLPNEVQVEKMRTVIEFLSCKDISHRSLLVVLTKHRYIGGKYPYYDNDILSYFREYYFMCPTFVFQDKDLDAFAYGDLKVDKTQYFDYFWVKTGE